MEITNKTRDAVREKLERGEKIDRYEIAADIGVSPRNVDNAIAVEKARRKGREEVEQLNASMLSASSQDRLEIFKKQELFKLQLSFEEAVSAKVKLKVAEVLAKRDAETLEAIEQANQVISHSQGRLRPPFSAPEYMVVMRALHPDSTTHENRMDAFKLCNSKKFLLRDEGKIAKTINTLPNTLEELDARRASAQEKRRNRR
jgi:ribosome-associated translation inhibitor RaiA